MRACSRSGGSARLEQVYGSVRLNQDWGQCEINAGLGTMQAWSRSGGSAMQERVSVRSKKECGQFEMEVGVGAV